MDPDGHLTLATGELEPGVHSFYLRALRSDGAPGLISRQLVYVEELYEEDPTPTIEYSFDVNGHYGGAALRSGVVGANGHLNLSTGDLEPGVHSFYLRALRSDGAPGIISRQMVYVEEPIESVSPGQVSVHYAWGENALAGGGGESAPGPDPEGGYYFDTSSTLVGENALYLRADVPGTPGILERVIIDISDGTPTILPDLNITGLSEGGIVTPGTQINLDDGGAFDVFSLYFGSGPGLRDLGSSENQAAGAFQLLDLPDGDVWVDIWGQHPASGKWQTQRTQFQLQTPTEQEIISNLGDDSDTTNGDLGNGTQFAVLFQAPSTNLKLDNICLSLNNAGGFDPSVMRVSLHALSSDPHLPGTELGTLTNPASFGTTTQDYVFTSDQYLELAADQQYWVVIDTHNDQAGPSWRNKTSDFVGTGSFIRARRSINDGQSYGELIQSSGIKIVGAPISSDQLIVSDVSGRPGETITVPIILDSSGAINGLSFSLNFDPQVFINPVLTKVNGFSDAQLIFNDNEAANGVIAAGLAYIDDTLFPSGSVHILDLSLEVLDSIAAGSSSISFGDEPVRSEMVGATGNVIPGDLIPGSVSVNQIPVAGDESVVTAEDTNVIIDVLANDSDGDGDPLSVILVGQPQNGSVSLNQDGTVTYSPGSNFHGSDSFTYRASDGVAQSNLAVVTLSVTSVDDVTVVSSGTSGAGQEDQPTPISGTLAAQDADGLTHNNIFQISNTNTPQKGSVTIDPVSGVWEYLPQSNAFGDDDFTVSILDDDGFTFNQLVTISIAEVNDLPEISGVLSVIINEDSEGGSGTIIVVDADGSSRSDRFAIHQQAIGGTGTVDPASGAWQYVPNANFNGQDGFDVLITDDLDHTFIQRIAVSVEPVNDPLTVVGGNSLTGLEDQGPFTATLEVTDDIDGLSHPGIFVISDVPANGVAQIDSASGAWSYQPDENFFGEDTFNVLVNDNDNHDEVVAVTITIDPVDDPVAVSGDISGSGDEDTEISGILIALDPADGLTDGSYFTVTSQGALGSAVIDPASGAWTYTPDLNKHGNDSFEVTISDDGGFTAIQVIQITIESINDALIITGGTGQTGDEDTVLGATLVVDDPDGLTGDSIYTVSSGPQNGEASINPVSGVWSYSPAANFNGIDQFVVSVADDDGFSELVNIDLVINPVADPPLALVDNYQVVENGALEINAANGVLNNDSHPDELTFEILNTGTEITTSAGALLTLNADGSFSYDPRQAEQVIRLEPGAILVDSFQYTLRDSAAAEITGNANIQISGVGFEGDLAGNEIGGQVYEDNILDVTDFVQAGRYLVQLDVLGSQSRLFSSMDTFPADVGGDGEISLSDWIQTGRYVVGLDSRVTKFGPVEAATSGGAALAFGAGRGGTPRRLSVDDGVSGQPAEIILSGSGFAAGQSGTVAVRAVSQGNVSSAGFTLEFDPDLAAFVDSQVISLPGARNLTLIVNSTQAEKGLLGILISAPPGETIPNGDIHLMDLTFDVGIDHHSGPFDLNLSDRIVRTSISNSIARKVGYSVSLELENVKSINDYNDWIAAYISKENIEDPTPVIIEENGDSDNDGIPNEVEFLLGTNPFKENNVPVETKVEEDDLGAVIEVTTEIIRERGDVEIEILSTSDVDEIFQTESTANSNSHSQSKHGREKRGIKFHADVEYKFFIIRVKPIGN